MSVYRVDVHRLFLQSFIIVIIFGFDWIELPIEVGILFFIYFLSVMKYSIEIAKLLADDTEQQILKYIQCTQ